MSSNTGAGGARGWPDEWVWSLLTSSKLVREADRAKLPTAADTGTIWEACVASGLLGDDEILAAIANRLRVPLASLHMLDPEARTFLGEEHARAFQAAPIRLDGRAIEVACANPLRPDLEPSLGFATGKRVRITLASPAQIREVLDQLYPHRDNIDQLIRNLDKDTEDAVLHSDPTGPAMIDPDVPVVKLVDALIAQGIRMRSSDLHIEPEESCLNVRCRVDGVMAELKRLPLNVAPSLVSRFKIMAGLDIADRLRPQDGRAHATFDGRRIALRVSTMPVASLGEKVVVRILDAGATAPTLPQIGFSQSELFRVERVLSGEEGLFLCTGPTGSGKTTTLYSALRALQTTAINIVTVEDPIEYRLQGVTQVQVNEKANVTFASVLRSLLRQDPDVILVGEIRDVDTAVIGIQASLTGHRVLSTLHTADAPSAITRIMGMGAEPTALAQALKGIVAQRLVRRVCAECREPIKVSDLPENEHKLLVNTPITQMYRAKGCEACNHTGYHGRTVVAEVVVVTNTISRAIAASAGPDEIYKLCRAAGMRTLWEAGLERVANGTTTMGELLATISPPIDEKDLNDELNQVDQTEQARSHPFERHSNPGAPRILIADDDRGVRSVFRAAIERSGFEVHEVEDGQAALDYISDFDPDAVLLDLNLPNVDGFGVLRELKTAVRRPPVLVVTGHDDPEFAEWAREAGAADVITKPIEPRLLAARLQALLVETAA